MSITTVVWREWTEMGTLPRNGTEVDLRDDDRGEDVAALVANQNRDYFQEGGTLVILEPAEHAGAYDIGVDWEPIFFADARDED